MMKIAKVRAYRNGIKIFEIYYVSETLAEAIEIFKADIKGIEDCIILADWLDEEEKEFVIA